MVEEFLSAEGGFEVESRYDGPSGVNAAIGRPFDVIVLDIMMPGMNGLDVLREIRKRVNTPVIMLTARGDDIDRILGLEIGADDYLSKPCNLRELHARIRAMLRRVARGSEEAPAQSAIIVGDVRLEPGSQSVYREDERVSVTGAEYLVLEVLARSAGQVVDKDAIARRALGRRNTPYDRSVDTHVSHLRRKLGPSADGLQRIKTVRGRGYLYVV